MINLETKQTNLHQGLLTPVLGSCYLYRHLRNDTGQPAYIGIGLKQDAFRKHETEYTRAYETTGRNRYWRNIHRKCGFTVEVLLDGLTLKEACEKEREFIKLYGRNDIGTGILCNCTDGGEGAFGRKVSDETKKKIGKAHKGRKHDPEVVARQAETYKTSYCPVVTCVETGRSYKGYAEVAADMFPKIKHAAKMISVAARAGKPYNDHNFTVEENPNRPSSGPPLKLSDGAIIEVKLLLNRGVAMKTVAKQFDVHPMTVRRIRNGVIGAGIGPEIDKTVPRLPDGKVLTEKEVLEIKSLKRILTNKQLVEKYGVSKHVIVNINQGRIWQGLT